MIIDSTNSDFLVLRSKIMTLFSAIQKKVVVISNRLMSNDLSGKEYRDELLFGDVLGMMFFQLISAYYKRKEDLSKGIDYDYSYYVAAYNIRCFEEYLRCAGIVYEDLTEDLESFFE